MSITFSDMLKRWPGENGWYYVLLPDDSWNELREIGSLNKRGFGAIKVIARIGKTSWSTSIFPDTSQKRYILFVKKDIRLKEYMKIDQEINGIVEVVT